MSEGEPKFEPVPEQALAKDLKYKGIDNPEVKQRLLAYVESQESNAQGVEGQVRLMIQLGKIYFERGLQKEAFENLEEALYVAQQAELTELHNEISQILYQYEDQLKEK